MPRPDHYPADIMDKCQAFSDALNAYLHLADRWERSWERRYSPSQTRIPAGQPGGGQWTDGGGSPGPAMPAVYHPEEDTSFVIHDVAHVLPEDAIRRILQTTPTVMDPTVGMIRGQPVTPPDATRWDMPYVEAQGRPELQTYLGTAGSGMQRHHIVPESSLGAIPDRPNDGRTVHNSSNLMDLKDNEHTCVTGLYNTNVETGGPLFRNAIKELPFGVQYGIGLQVIEYCKEKRRREAEGESIESFVREPRSFLPKKPEEAAEPPTGWTTPQTNLPPPILPFSSPRSGGGSSPLGGSFALPIGSPMGGGAGTSPLMKRKDASDDPNSPIERRRSSHLGDNQVLQSRHAMIRTSYR